MPSKISEDLHESEITNCSFYEDINEYEQQYDDIQEVTKANLNEESEKVRMGIPSFSVTANNKTTLIRRSVLKRTKLFLLL